MKLFTIISPKNVLYFCPTNIWHQIIQYLVKNRENISSKLWGKFRSIFWTNDNIKCIFNSEIMILKMNFSYFSRSLSAINTSNKLGLTIGCSEVSRHFEALFRELSKSSLMSSSKLMPGTEMDLCSFMVVKTSQNEFARSKTQKYFQRSRDTFYVAHKYTFIFHVN